MLPSFKLFRNPSRIWSYAYTFRPYCEIECFYVIYDHLCSHASLLTNALDNRHIQRQSHFVWCGNKYFTSFIRYWWINFSRHAAPTSRYAKELELWYTNKSRRSGGDIVVLHMVAIFLYYGCNLRTSLRGRERGRFCKYFQSYFGRTVFLCVVYCTMFANKTKSHSTLDMFLNVNGLFNFICLKIKVLFAQRVQSSLRMDVVKDVEAAARDTGKHFSLGMNFKIMPKTSCANNCRLKQLSPIHSVAI